MDRKACIIILEENDRMAFRDKLSCSLMELGYEVLTVSQPEQLLTLAKQIECHAIVIGSQLPILEELQLIQDVRQYATESQLILLSNKKEALHVIYESLQLDHIAAQTASPEEVADTIHNTLLHTTIPPKEPAMLGPAFEQETIKRIPFHTPTMYNDQIDTPPVGISTVHKVGPLITPLVEEQESQPTRKHALMISEEEYVYLQLRQALQNTEWDCHHAHSLTALSKERAGQTYDVVLLYFPNTSTPQTKHRPSLPLSLRPLPPALRVAQQLRKTMPSTPILLFGMDIPLSQQLLASHIKHTFYIEQQSLLRHCTHTLNQLMSIYQTKPKLLYLSNDVGFAKELKTYLAKSGIEVEIALSPMHLLHKLPSTKPDLLLVDYELPSMNGLDLCRILRTMPAWHKTPYFILVETADSRLYQSSVRLGVDRLVHKHAYQRELLPHMQSRLQYTSC